MPRRARDSSTAPTISATGASAGRWPRGRAELGGEEDLVAPAADALADRPLAGGVGVVGRRVEVADAALDRLAHHVGARRPSPSRRRCPRRARSCARGAGRRRRASSPTRCAACPPPSAAGRRRCRGRSATSSRGSSPRGSRRPRHRRRGRRRHAGGRGGSRPHRESTPGALSRYGARGRRPLLRRSANGPAATARVDTLHEPPEAAAAADPRRSARAFLGDET